MLHPFINSEGQQDHFFIDKRLVSGLTKIKEKVNTKDFDQVFLIDGMEGSGKSVFAMQLAVFLDPSMNLRRVCMNSEEFVHAIQTAEKGQVIIYDEAYTGLAARQALSKVNKLIVSMMMEMRQKNLIVIIVLPTFFMLDRYVAVFRSRGLFHVYLNKGRRGFWLYYNQKKKKLLYILGKKYMSYGQPKVKLKGQFRGKYVLNEESYRQKKNMALKNRDTKKMDDTVYKNREQNLVYVIMQALRDTTREKNMSFRTMEVWFRDHNWPINRGNLAKIWGEHTAKTANLAG